MSITVLLCQQTHCICQQYKMDEWTYHRFLNVHDGNISSHGISTVAWRFSQVFFPLSSHPSFSLSSISNFPPLPLEIRAKAILLPELSLTLISAGNPAATNIQTHINLSRDAFSFLFSFCFFFFFFSLSCPDFNLLDQAPLCRSPPHLIWHRIESFGGILSRSCVDVWFACKGWSSCGGYCSFATKWEIHCDSVSVALH